MYILCPSFLFVSVLISHLTLAGIRGSVRSMFRHIDAGARSLDRAYRLSGHTPALKDSLYLGGIDSKWV